MDKMNCVEKKHTSPIHDIETLSKFSIAKVDPETVCRHDWKCKINSGSKVLVCHDMEGGYNDDRFIHGTNNPDFYNFYHWAQIDNFVYFSHKLVTIPPYMWIDVCHRNGVKVLGTFITEWDHGADNCYAMFGTPETAIHYAKKLAEIAHSYNFDGWLINIENILNADGVDNIQIFLQCLTLESKALNEESSILWYDAVTKEGKLEWQDCVSDLNSCFLACCDGIFLNYTWSDWKLKLTSELCLGRFKDVYVGIDVWARGCVGKFDCHISTEKISEYGFSVALFAPAWCYQQTKPDFSAFLEHNNKFWNLLQPTCSPKPLQLCHNTDYVTNFSFGFGRKVYKYGFLLFLESWYNLAKQDVPFINFIKNEHFEVSISDQDAFEGSTSLKVETQGSSLHLDKLICLDLCRKGGEVILICKESNGSKVSDLNLLITEKNGTRHILSQVQNMFIGGNHWRRLVFLIEKQIDLRWIGLKSDRIGLNILIGQLKL